MATFWNPDPYSSSASNLANALMSYGDYKRQQAEWEDRKRFLQAEEDRKQEEIRKQNLASSLLMKNMQGMSPSMPTQEVVREPYNRSELEAMLLNLPDTTSEQALQQATTRQQAERVEAPVPYTTESGKTIRVMSPDAQAILDEIKGLTGKTSMRSALRPKTTIERELERADIAERAFIEAGMPERAIEYTKQKQAIIKAEEDRESRKEEKILSLTLMRDKYLQDGEIKKAQLEQNKINAEQRAYDAAEARKQRAFDAEQNRQTQLTIAGMRGEQKKEERGWKASQLTPKEQEELGDTQALLDNAMKVKEIFTTTKGRSIGPVAGRKTSISLTTGIGVDPTLANLDSTLANISNTMLKLRSGAAVTESEFNRFKKEFPTINDDPKVFNIKLNNTIENFNRIIDKKTQKLKGNTPDAQTNMPTKPNMPSGKRWVVGADGILRQVQ